MLHPHRFSYANLEIESRQIIGIDTLTALTFISEIGDFRRFGKAHEFMAYLGLVPAEHSSGEKRRVGAITKAGITKTTPIIYRILLTPFSFWEKG